MHARLLITTIVTVGVVAPVAAFASSAPPRPAAGKWKVVGDSGGFTVGHNQKSISGLHLTPKPADSCGTGKITVSGTQKLTTTSRGGYTNWIVGKSTPKTSSGVSPVTVKVHQAGKTMTGGLDIVFAIGGRARSNQGTVNFGSCLLSFYANK